MVLYFLAPGHPDLPAHGVPLGPVGTAIITAAVLAAVYLRSATTSRQVFSTFVIVVCALLSARVMIGRFAPTTGWTARYYANERWAGAPEWSSEFPRFSATRVDRTIRFKDNTFPAHYLNDLRFNRGIRREVAEPLSIEWSGFGFTEGSHPQTLSLTARGLATVHVDDNLALSVSSKTDPQLAEAVITLTPGAHALVVRYVKSANTDGLIEFAASPPLQVTTTRPAGSTDDGLLIAGVGVDAALLAVFVVAVVFAARSLRVQRTSARWRFVTPTLFLLFGLQGFWQASRFSNRLVTLTPGDDWFGFEASAREILHHGPLLTFGQPLGAGGPYFYHPFYPYFLAAVHALTGESLFGPVFVQFLILATVAAILWRTTANLFGETPAVAGLIVLVIVLEVDFARYYTVTLLSENLYILTVTLTLVPFMRWVRNRAPRDLWWTGFWAGVSSITRPAMLIYLIPALALVALLSFERTRRVRDTSLAIATVAVAWFLVITPVTLRNWVVSHRFVLISDGLGAGFVKYNLPGGADPLVYTAQSGGGVLSGIRALLRIAWDHPFETFVLQGRKLGFSLGMVHWFEGYRPHPELIAVTIVYAATCVMSPRMRSRLLWPVHLFVLSHVASMGLTSPWNYGYRLIIPPFVFTSVLAGAAACSLVLAARARAAGTPNLAESHF